MISGSSSESSCDKQFQDGQCDKECDTTENLFDGYDCAVPVSSCMSSHCDRYFMDGVCHGDCNNAACLWDGGDCITTTLDLSHDGILLNVRHAQSLAYDANDVTKRSRKQMSRRLSQMAAGNLVRVMPMDLTNADSHHGIRRLQKKTVGDKVVLRLDNTNCKERCLNNSLDLAKYLHHYNTVTQRKHSQVDFIHMTGVVQTELVVNVYCKTRNV